MSTVAPSHPIVTAGSHQICHHRRHAPPPSPPLSQPCTTITSPFIFEFGWYMAARGRSGLAVNTQGCVCFGGQQPPKGVGACCDLTAPKGRLFLRLMAPLDHFVEIPSGESKEDLYVIMIDSYLVKDSLWCIKGDPRLRFKVAYIDTVRLRYREYNLRERLNKLQYTISIDDMMKSSPVCLLSKASKTKSWLWHRRLNHLNFGTINDLARKDLVRGLPRLKFEKDHLCSACQLGKSKKYSHKPKSENTNMEVLHTLHMDLCGPMRVQSINGKKYILVIVDDYSRFIWVKFLRSKDETPEFVINFLKQIQVGLNKTVRYIRTDNGTEFVNQVMLKYYEDVGIFHQKFVPRTPQQNGIVKRRNRTLVEASRTMLIFSKASMFLWAKVVATACYTQNRSLIHTRHNKTPYELVHDKKSDLTFLRVFGALCYPANDSEGLGDPRLRFKIRLGLRDRDTYQRKNIVIASRYHQEELYIHKEEMAPMALSDSKVNNDKSCSKTCLTNYEALKKQYDDLLVKLDDTGFKAATYKRGLATLEEQIIKYREHEVLFSEEIALLKRSVGHKEYQMGLLRDGLEKVKQEKEGFEFKIAKFDKSAKDLEQLLASQITDKSKKGFGYNVVPSPHPLILNRPTPLDLSYSGLDEFKEPEFKGYGPENSKKESNVVCENSSNETKKNSDAPLIEEWVSDDEDEVETTVVVKKKTVIPTAAKIEKPVRKPVKTS
ncbi:retrovirus-related pol polyprotein from transposon TNT 1-94 [Tanacetum coccineum]